MSKNPILSGYQRKYLRGLAHGLKPVILIGQKGKTDTVVKALDEALSHHELVKIKFNEFKEKAEKQRLTALLESETSSHFVGMIGHIAIFYRPHPEPEKRKILLQ